MIQYYYIIIGFFFCFIIQIMRYRFQYNIQQEKHEINVPYAII